MNYTAEQLQENWDKFLSRIETYISEPRRTQLLEFHKKYEERFILMPASGKKEFHGCYPGGYISHVISVIDNSLLLYNIWKQQGAILNSESLEELMFSAIIHDLGKFGDFENESYIPQTDQWRKDKLGETYMFNTALPFASVPDRGLFILQQEGIKYSFNEMITIQTHDGLYDEANKKYLQGFLPEQKPRTCLPYILHQADIMTARIEFEEEHQDLIIPNSVPKEEPKQSFKLETKKSVVKQKAMQEVVSKTPNSNLMNLLNDL